MTEPKGDSSTGAGIAGWPGLLGRLEQALEGALAADDASAVVAAAEALEAACGKEPLPGDAAAVAALARRAESLLARAADLVRALDEAKAALGQAQRAAQAYPRG